MPAIVHQNVVTDCPLHDFKTQGEVVKFAAEKAEEVRRVTQAMRIRDRQQGAFGKKVCMGMQGRAGRRAGLRSKGQAM
jgi:hypothetical protein